MSSGTQDHVRVYGNYELMSRAAGEFFIARCRTAILQKGRCAAALSGGSTPKKLYSLLASSRLEHVIDWSQVHLFWADERCVPPDHRESNFKLVNDILLSSIDIPRGNIHRIRGEAGPDEAAREYEEDIRTFFGSGSPAFDLIVLGVGEDGHTASIFPASEAIREARRIAMPVFLHEPGINRVTLTLPVINLAFHIMVLASGRSKAGIIAEILSEKNPKNYPAGLVHPERGDLKWLLDAEAAEQIRHRYHT